MLRRLRLEMALQRLEHFVRYHCGRGRNEVVVVVGKGLRSAEQRAILGPAVRQWCARHPGLVESVSTAPADEGGDGALLLRLRRLTDGAPNPGPHPAR